jgi:hypothetical protein
MDSFGCGMCDYSVESLDITSFRPVQSLQEDVHERIVEFLSDLQQDNVTILDAVQELDSLYMEVDSRLGSSSSDTIRSEDRDYLLQMINQIDELIASLEGDGDSRVIQLRESCVQLKNLFS